MGKKIKIFYNLYVDNSLWDTYLTVLDRAKSIAQIKAYFNNQHPPRIATLETKEAFRYVQS